MAEPKIRVGDVVDVPRGVDDVCTTRYRVRVDEISAYGITGARLRADGTPMVSRSVLSDDGLVIRSVPWDVVKKSTLIRKPTPRGSVVEDRPGFRYCALQSSHDCAVTITVEVYDRWGGGCSPCLGLPESTTETSCR